MSDRPKPAVPPLGSPKRIRLAERLRDARRAMDDGVDVIKQLIEIELSGSRDDIPKEVRHSLHESTLAAVRFARHVKFLHDWLAPAEPNERN